MMTRFERLRERVATLGNHHRKYLLDIASHKDHLIGRLEAEGLVQRVDLWEQSEDPGADMSLILELGGQEQDTLVDLGCYYAFQFLHLNLHQTDVLRFDLASKVEPVVAYKKFMLRSGAAFRKLTAAYMEKLLDLFIPPAERPEFVICGVGTRADQDDIDLGIIDGEGTPESRAALNQGIGRLINEMLKRACQLHLYLSEHFGSQRFSASIPEYLTFVRKRLSYFIVISELLNAKPILGSTRLFEEFQKRITDRYFYHPEGNNRYHEGYLRGMLGELRALMIGNDSPQRIHLKDDGLRMARMMIFVWKTIHNVEKVNCWEILDELCLVRRRHVELYQRFERALTFVETFRILHHLYNVQEEEVILGDPAMEQVLDRIAGVMGYADLGVIKARNHLLVHYSEAVRTIKEVVTEEIGGLKKHLNCISILKPMIQAAKRGQRVSGDNVAFDFKHRTRLLRRTRYWEDITGALEKDERLMKLFVKDFNALGDTERRRLLRRYADCGQSSVYTLFSLLAALACDFREPERYRLFIDLHEMAMGRMDRFENVIMRATEAFRHNPAMLNRYLSALNEDQQRDLAGKLTGEVWDDSARRIQKQLLHLCQLHFESSHFFRRIFHKVVNKYPKFLPYLDDTEKLGQLAKGLAGNIWTQDTIGERKETLGQYYDLEYLRVGLTTLEGKPVTRINADFTEFCDNYIRTLFGICKQELDRELGAPVATKDLLAVFTAGGHAREQAFDDDYDLIVLLNSQDQELKRYASRIITRMNSEIIKRGILPHYRFVDHFGYYVTTFYELDLFLAENADAFIDKSQLLGSRMVIGSSKFEREFDQRVITPHIYNRSVEYAAFMIEEIRERRLEPSLTGEDGSINIKECPGGLRDIEMALLAYKAFYRLREPVNQKLVWILSMVDRKYGADILTLGRAFDFLRGVRDLYRLTGTADDVIRPDFLKKTAAILNYVDREGAPDVALLLQRCHETITEVHSIVERLIAALQKKF